MKLRIPSSLAMATLALLATVGSVPVPATAGEAPTTTAKASDAAEVTEAERRAAATLESASKGDLRVETFFSGPGGLIGLVVRKEDMRNIAWATPDGSHIILGSVVDGDGNNHTRRYADLVGVKVGPRTSMRNFDGSLSVLDTQLSEVKKQVVATEGEGDRELYVFMDPMCPHCRDSYNAMKQAANQRALKVHWVLTNTLGQTYSTELIDAFRSKKASLGDLMTAPQGEPRNIKLGKGTAPYVDESTRLLEEVFRNRAVPAVIYQENGRWKAAIGFNPAEYATPKEGS